MDCRNYVGSNNHCNIKIKIVGFANCELTIVEEEAYESMFFLEMFLEISEMNHIEIKKLHAEANEILSIIVASIKTMRARKEMKK